MTLTEEQKIKHREAQRRYREKNKEKCRESTNKWMNNNKEKRSKWRENNRDKTRVSKWKYQGIICNDWEALLKRYHDADNCELCGITMIELSTKMDGKCCDHDHSIKDRENVRMIVCRKCNLMDERLL